MILLNHFFEKRRLRKIAKLFHQLYDGVNGALIVAKEKKEKGLTYDPDFIYGEIEFASFIEVVQQCQPTADDVFYDLGSGAGKAVIAAALFQPNMVCHGIEKLVSLYQCSSERARQLSQLCDQYKLSCAPVHFQNADFFDADFQSATLLFVNATSLISDSWQVLQEKLRQLKTNTRIIVISKQLKTPQFKLIYQSPCDMSWGTSYVFIYRKIG